MTNIELIRTISLIIHAVRETSLVDFVVYIFQFESNYIDYPSTIIHDIYDF